MLSVVCQSQIKMHSVRAKIKDFSLTEVTQSDKLSGDVKAFLNIGNILFLSAFKVARIKQGYSMANTNCPNKNKPIATYTMNANDPARTTWDLTPYKGAGIGPAGGTWRLIEVGYNLLYYSGKISSDGTLVSDSYVEPSDNVMARNIQKDTPSALPDSFVTHYSYDGYMELQVSAPPEDCTTCPCPEEEGGKCCDD